MKRETLSTCFVEFIPESIEQGILYIAMENSTAIHKCACGCGQEVVTPLSPTDWKISYDGISTTLFPSIGNWGFACRSHYWIIENGIHWAGDFTAEKIDAIRRHDRHSKDQFYQNSKTRNEVPETRRLSFLQRVFRWIMRN